METNTNNTNNNLRRRPQTVWAEMRELNSYKPFFSNSILRYLVLAAAHVKCYQHVLS